MNLHKNKHKLRDLQQEFNELCELEEKEYLEFSDLERPDNRDYTFHEHYWFDILEEIEEPIKRTELIDIVNDYILTQRSLGNEYTQLTSHERTALRRQRKTK